MESPRYLLRNSDGDRDGTWTLLVFIVVCLMVKFLIAGITVSISGRTWDMGATDAAFAIAMVGPAYAAYTSRRNTERKATVDEHKATVEAKATVDAAKATSGGFPPVRS